MGTRIAGVDAGSASFGPSMVRDVHLSDALEAAGVGLASMDTDPGRLPEIGRHARTVAERLRRDAWIPSTTRNGRRRQWTSPACL